MKKAIEEIESNVLVSPEGGKSVNEIAQDDAEVGGSNSTDGDAKARIRAAVENSISRKRKIGVKRQTHPETSVRPSSIFANIKQNEPNLFAPLTDEVEDADVHYIEGVPGEGGQYLHCNGEDCVLCEAKKSPSVLLMMPFYDLRRRELVVIKGGASEHASSLFNQVEQALLSDPEVPFCLQIEKADRYSFKVKVKKLDGKHLDKEQYLAAKEIVSAPGYNLQELIARKTNEELLEEYPSIRSDLQLMRDVE